MVNIHQLQMISYEQEAHRTSQDVQILPRGRR